MGVAEARMNRQIALTGAALTHGCHMLASVHGMDLKRRVNRKKPQRDVMRTRTNVEYARSMRQMSMDCSSERIAPSRTIPERCDRIAFVVVGGHVPENFGDQVLPGFLEEMRTKTLFLPHII